MKAEAYQQSYPAIRSGCILPVAAIPRDGRTKLHLKAIRGLFLLLFVTILGTGCAMQGPLPAWQREVERYIAQGNGDPSVLRDTVDLRARSAPRPARVTFGKLNVPGPGLWPFRSTWDINGVLVGQHTTGSENWFLFMVGIIQRQPASDTGIEDIRLLGFYSAQNRLHWCMAPKTQEAVDQYVRTWLPQNLAEDGTQSTAPTFPADADVFTLEPDDHTLTVTEQHSGASWRMQLPPS